MSQHSDTCRHCNQTFRSELISSAGLCLVCEARDKEYYANLNKELDAMSQDNDNSWTVRVRTCAEGWCAAPIKLDKDGVVEEHPVEIFPGKTQSYVEGYARRWEDQLNEGEEQSDEPVCPLCKCTTYTASLNQHDGVQAVVCGDCGHEYYPGLKDEEEPTKYQTAYEQVMARMADISRIAHECGLELPPGGK